MAGFNVPTQMTPELLAQIAAAAFRPPQAMSMPGLNVSAPQTPGFNVGLGEGMASLRAGLQALKDMGGDGTIVNAGPQGSGPGGAYSPADAMRMAGLNRDPMDPSHGVPSMKQGGGLGMQDFLTGAWRGITDLFGSGGSASAGGASGGGSSGGGFGGAASAALPLAYAAAIGFGKNTEANHANTPFGDVLLGGLGPSAAQIFEDPIGMGLPTLLGAPFLTPFLASKEAKAKKPEWSSLFSLGV